MQLSKLIWAPLLALAAFASAQEAKPLSIGDKAPAFPVEGWVKGTPVKQFEKGKVYVVEFWATWCGPCINSMPHLSDMADEMRGKVEFISVNTWDRRVEGEKEAGSKAHVDRVTEWVKKNDAKMRYTIALDDEKDTIANTWMRAAGRNGIPCAFVVNQEGNIAWIGHPMDKMDEVTKAVHNNTYDIAAAKAKFDAEMKEQLAMQAQQKLLSDAAKSGNLPDFEKVWQSQVDKNPKAAPSMVMQGVSMLSTKNPELAFEFLTKHEADVKANPTMQVQAGYIISRSTKDKPELAKKVAAYSTKAVAGVPDAQAAVYYCYHAQTLLSAGDSAGANEWVEKASLMIDKFAPAAQKDAVQKFVDGIKKQISAGK